MARNRGAAVAAPADADSATTQRMRIPTNGPHDGDTLGPEITPAPGTVDFGAVRVPVPVGGTVSVEPTTAGHVQAVHVTVPEGRLSVSALAAPRTGGLWADLATEIDASLREGGARVRSFAGEWGRELHATTDGATSVFVGVDGPRWMLYGVATGPTRDAVSLDARLRRMLRGTVVVRGKAPYPVRTVLPLAMPSEGVAEQQAAPSAPPTMTLRAPAGAVSTGAVSNGAGPAAANASVNGTASPNRAPAGSLPAAAVPNGTVNGVPPQPTNGALPAAAGAAASGRAANGVAPGAAPNGATTGVLRTNGATRTGGSRTGASRPGRTRTGVPPAVASTTGATPTGAGRTDVPAVGGPARNASTTGGARTGVPAVGASTTGATRTDQPAVPPPNAAVSRTPAAANGAAGPGVPLLGAPTSGTPRSAAARTAPAGTGGNRPGGSTTGANRSGADRSGANTVGATNAGATWSGGYPTGAMPLADAEPGTSPYGMPANGAPRQHATTGGTPAGHGLSPTAAARGGAAPAGPTWPPTPGATPVSGPFPTDAPQNRPSSSARIAGHPNPTDPHSTTRAHGQAPTGGFPRPAVPVAWAHETGGHPPWSAESSTGGAVATPAPAAAASMTPLPTVAAAMTPLQEPSAPPPVPPVAASSRPQPEVPWSPSPPERQVAAAAWQSARVEPAPAASDRDSTGHWDPLVDPLPVDLDPLPAPQSTWNAGRSNGRYDAVFDSGLGTSDAPHRGAPDDARAPANGVAASRRRADPLWDRDEIGTTGGPRWRAADLLDGRNDAHREADAAATRWRAADLLAGRDDRVSGDVAAPTWGAADLLAGRDDGVSGDVAAPTWRAADLLAGRDDRVSGDAAAPKWRAADLLAGRDDRVSGDAAAPKWRAADLLAGRDESDATDSAAGWDRLDEVHDRAARSRQAIDGPADETGSRVGASRWQAADLLAGRDRAGHAEVGGRSRRRRTADTPDVRIGAPEPLDGLRGRTAAADDGRVMSDRIDTGASRWRAADLLDGPDDAQREASTAGPRWRAADLLAGDGGTMDDGSGPGRRRARTSDVGDRQAADSQATPLWSAVGTGSAEPYPDTRPGRRRGATAREELIRPNTPTDDGLGRRYAPTIAATRHDVGVGHHDDAQPRHGGGNRHTAPPRVPPTQWAWPKDPDLSSAEAPRARGADDDAWSAADLLEDGRHAGGRRRAPESARHGRPDADHATGAGRHYGP